MEQVLEYELLGLRNVGEKTLHYFKDKNGPYYGMGTLFYLQLVNEQLVPINSASVFIIEELKGQRTGSYYPCIRKLFDNGILNGYQFDRRVWITKDSISRAFANGYIY